MTGIVGNVSGNIMLSTLEQIAKNIKNPIAFAKAYILYSLGSMLAATNSWKVTLNYATYLQGELKAVSSYNWSKHIVDSLIAAMDDLPTKKTYPGGDMNFLVLHFLDMVNLDGLSPSFTPTCGFWDNAKVARAWKKIKGSE
ncbi:hypothetical protein LINGRAHAP2_LOCUS32815, partial [Linum grandiflorum]